MIATPHPTVKGTVIGVNEYTECWHCGLTIHRNNGTFNAWRHNGNHLRCNPIIARHHLNRLRGHPYSTKGYPIRPSN